MDILYSLYVVLGLIAGIIILLALHYMGDFPFPWQLRTLTRRASEPDTTALSECFGKIADKEQIHLVMGNASSLVCEQKAVLESLNKCLEKDITIKLIHGPELDTRSTDFLGTLSRSSKVELYIHPENPPLHFRVIIDSRGHPKEVYVEEPHRPYEDRGYRHIISQRVSRQYEDIFQKMMQGSKTIQNPSIRA